MLRSEIVEAYKTGVTSVLSVQQDYSGHQNDNSSYFYWLITSAYYTTRKFTVTMQDFYILYVRAFFFSE